MKQSIYMKKTLICVWLAMTACFALGVMSIVSIVNLSEFDTPYVEMFFLLAFAAIAFMTVWKQFEQLTEKIEVTENELIYYSMFRREKNLSWKDISECGVGQVLSPTGIKYCFFFSKRRLSEKEIDNLGAVGDDCIYLSNLTRKNYEIISKYCAASEAKLLEKWVSNRSETQLEAVSK